MQYWQKRKCPWITLLTQVNYSAGNVQYNLSCAYYFWFNQSENIWSKPHMSNFCRHSQVTFMDSSIFWGQGYCINQTLTTQFSTPKILFPHTLFPSTISLSKTIITRWITDYYNALSFSGKQLTCLPRNSNLK
jgi:hypothetical protein